MLLVMGLGLPGALWAPLLPALSAVHRVATFDHRGVGSQVDVPPATSMEEVADDVGRALDELGWTAAHLVGVSLGGMAIQEFAVRRPHRVRSLALLATTAHGARVLPPTLEALAAVLVSRTREDRLRRLLYPSSWRAGHRAEIDERTRRMAEAFAPPATVRAQFRAVLGHDTRHRLGTLRCPVLVVKPASDAMIRPSASDELCRRIPGARRVDLPGVGHGLLHQAAEPLSGHLLDHLRRAG